VRSPRVWFDAGVLGNVGERQRLFRSGAEQATSQACNRRHSTVGISLAGPIVHAFVPVHSGGVCESLANYGRRFRMESAAFFCRRPSAYERQTMSTHSGGRWVSSGRLSTDPTLAMWYSAARHWMASTNPGEMSTAYTFPAAPTARAKGKHGEESRSR